MKQDQKNALEDIIFEINKVKSFVKFLTIVDIDEDYYEMRVFQQLKKDEDSIIMPSITDVSAIMSIAEQMGLTVVINTFYSEMFKLADKKLCIHIY